MSSFYLFYDRKANVFVMPFTAPNDSEAYRAFAAIMMDPNATVSQYPADFDLVRVGVVDLTTGVLTPETHPYVMVNGLVCLQDAERQRRRYQEAMQTLDEASPDAA